MQSALKIQNDAANIARAAARKSEREAIGASKEIEAAASNNARKEAKRSRYSARVHVPLQDGCAIVFSDAHFWPGEQSTAFKALRWLVQEYKPFALIDNGDSFDGATISRWPRIGWDAKPTVQEELAVNCERHQELEELAPDAYRTWNLGNHDARFETFLAAKAPEYQGVTGFSLRDHFPGWMPAWSTWLGDQVIIKHRISSGKYAAANNVLRAGRTIVTGHDHRLYEFPLSTYVGNLYGIDSGTLADVYGPMFKDYTEDNPVDWQSGFPILWFRDGRYAGCELVRVQQDGAVFHRGNIYSKL